MSRETVYPYGSGTFAERSAAMVRSLTVSSVASSDQYIILDEMETRDFDGINPRARLPYKMTVAHISDTGWIDIFMAEIDYRGGGEYDSRTRHVSLPRSQAEMLFGAFTAHHSVKGNQ